MIIGNSTGKWDMLTIGNHGQVLVASGSDIVWATSTVITELGTITTGIWEGTVIATSSGGTGASNLTDARANLGLAINSDIMGYDASLSDFAALAASNDYFVVGNGVDDWETQSTSTVRSTLGMGNIYDYAISSPGALPKE